MTDLIDTTEMYLRTILELEEEGVPPLRARIAERLGHSGPTVSQTVARMDRDGLLRIDAERRLVLTDEGRATAVRVMRRHRIAERLLVDVIGLPWDVAHEEACRWEHVMSTAVEERVLALVGDAQLSPYGNPIPGLDELGRPQAGAFLDGVSVLTELLAAADGARVRGRLLRIGEFVQADPANLGALQGAGAVAGAEIVALDQADGVRVEGPDGACILPADCAGHLFVSPM